jgi:hypothetical protein
MNVIYEHVNFNADWAAKQSLEDFQKHEAHVGLTKDQLAEAHKMCKQAVNKDKKEEIVSAEQKEATVLKDGEVVGTAPIKTPGHK